MTWFKIDDGFWSHPKTATLSSDAVALWVRAGSYSCQHLTDGEIPAPMLRMLGTADAAEELVAAGLWYEEGNGWSFHDWGDYQETRETVRKRRDEARERQAKARERAAERRRKSHEQSQEPSRDTSHVTDDVTHGVSSLYPTRPDPTRPGRSNREEPIAHPAAAPDAVKAVDNSELFDRFWHAYPVKKGKADARKAFAKAIKSTSIDTILAGVDAYKRELGPVLGGKTLDGRTPKWAQGWLNGQRWEDEPDGPSLDDQWGTALASTDTRCASGHVDAGSGYCARCGAPT